MSSIWAVVPMKGFDHAKSRLRHSLAPHERRTVAATLFERALSACLACVERGVLDRVLVATDAETIARDVSARAGCSALLDTRPTRSFASVIDRSLAHAHASGASRAIVIMADLPEIAGSDVAHLVYALGNDDLLVVPDRARRGVGAVGCKLPARLPMQLGRGDSFMRHVAVARDRGLRWAVVSSPRVAGDLDTADDLARAKLVQAP